MLTRDKNIYCVYFHRNSFTKEIFYVGIGKLKRAHDIHGRSSYWRKYVSKYGRTVQILFENLIWNEACQIEIYLIAYYKRNCDPEGILINRTIGGEGATGSKRPDLAAWNRDKSIVKKRRVGFVLSEESRAKLSNSLKGRASWNAGTKGTQPKWTEEHRAKMIKAQKGRKFHPEVREKLRKAHIGKPRTEEHKAKMRGIPKSEDHKRKISEARKGKPVTEHQRKCLLEGRLLRISQLNQNKTAKTA